MPPPLSKKIKGRDGRRSSSRHTTPSSTISAPMASPTPTKTAFLDIPISDLAIPVNVKYEDILERHGGNGGIPDPKHLETIADNLRMLAKLAQSRTKYNDMGMRALAVKRKEALEQEREREMEARELEQQEIARKQAEEEEAAREKKNGKSKRKERSRVREEKPQDRPLNHGAHGLARQDGVNLPVKGVLQLSYYGFSRNFGSMCFDRTRSPPSTSLLPRQCFVLKDLFCALVEYLFSDVFLRSDLHLLRVQIPHFPFPCPE